MFLLAAQAKLLRCFLFFLNDTTLLSLTTPVFLLAISKIFFARVVKFNPFYSTKCLLILSDLNDDNQKLLVLIVARKGTATSQFLFFVQIFRRSQCCRFTGRDCKLGSNIKILFYNQTSNTKHFGRANQDWMNHGLDSLSKCKTPPITRPANVPRASCCILKGEFMECINYYSKT